LCGIFGFTGYHDRDRLNIIQSMSNLLTHRGPDNFGFWIGESVALGMNRLSIIDLYRGFQPIWNEDKTVVVILNGEIYNYKILTELLKEKGHRFYTTSDTEVLVHLYEEYGPLFVEKISGMFAYALFDLKKEKLFLGRDRIGIKPLYYYLDKTGDIAFASEAKALINTLGISKDINNEALKLFFALFYVPEPLTIWEKIKKLEPGYYLEWSNYNVRKICYWDLNNIIYSAINSEPKRKQIDAKSYKEELQYLFKSLIKEHLISDVPVATLLSSGIDSTLVTRFASEISPTITSFTISTEGEDDESSIAQETAKSFNIAHYIKPANMSILNKLPLLLWHLDEPFADSSMFPTYIISNLISQTHRVALSGDGGDEVFGGYNYYRMFPYLIRAEKIPIVIKSILGPVVKLLPDALISQIAKKLGIQGTASIDRSIRFIKSPSYWSLDGTFQFAKEWIPSNTRKLLFPYKYIEFKSIINNYFSRFLSISDYKEYYPIIYSALDLSLGLPGDMLTKVDRMSMANSLEIRVPFCDHRLIEWMFNLPLRFLSNALIGKRFLKEVFKDYIPQKVMEGKKRGFGIPLGQWLEKDKKIIANIILAKKSYIREYLNEKYILNEIKSNLIKDDIARYSVWASLIFEVWAKIFIEMKGAKPDYSLKEIAK